MAASTRDKERNDLLVTTNSTGRQGCCLPTDMCCEHPVRKVKDLLKSYHNQLETILIKKSVLAENSILIMNDHFFKCMGKGDLASGGGHRHDYLEDSEKKRVRSELKKLRLFDPEKKNSKVFHHVKVRRVWQNLTEEGIDIFLDRNCIDYKRKKNYRFN